MIDFGENTSIKAIVGFTEATKNRISSKLSLLELLFIVVLMPI